MATYKHIPSAGGYCSDPGARTTVVKEVVIKEREAPTQTQEIVELRPNFFGLGFNLKALYQWLRQHFRQE